MFFLFPLLVIASLEKVLFWTGMWQNKEYRFDRIIVHLRETNQGKGLFLSPFTIFGIVTLLLYAVVVMVEWFAPIFQLFVIGYFLSSVFHFGKNIAEKKVKRPVVTAKSGLILFLSFFIILFLFFFPLTDTYLWILLLLGITPFLVALFVGIFSFPTEVYTDYLCQKAEAKLKKLKRVTVIAVSGSYGKSSTKEAIAHILSEKFSVVKTPLSNNTAIGIAKTILTKLNDQTDFFVVEMGAYKIGEIAQLSAMVKPDISITTAVSDQHISLYGSLENVIASEKELILSLPKDGLAFFNKNNKNTDRISEKTKQKKVFYKTTKEKGKRKSNEIVAYGVTAKTDGIVFTVVYQHHTYHFHTSLLGKHVIENILPGIALGIRYGLSENQLQHAVATLTPLPQTMQKKIISDGIIGVDDTFNASPESVMAAGEYLALFPKKKFFVLTPLIELGKDAGIRHQEIGRLLSDVDYLLVTNKNYYNNLQAGIAMAKGKALLMYGSYVHLLHFLEKTVQKGDCIIFEGKEAGVILKKML